MKANDIAEYQADDDLRILMMAEKIKKDKKRFAAAQKCAKQKIIDMEATMKVEDESK